MYYPLLRARQFELIALRELCMENQLDSCIVPIIEPVKESHNNLNLAYRVFDDKNQPSYLIMNPVVGEQAGDNGHYLDYFRGLNSPNVQPAFHYRRNSEYIIRSIRENHLNHCMIICPNEINVDNSDLTDLIQIPEVAAIVLKDPGRNRSLQRYIRALNKIFIRLDDLFEKQARNSDFLEIAEHLFSEEHLYYTEENFTGFGDYTVLPSEYSDSGSTPRAVVIHLTYLNAQNQIWIRHFTSETNDSIANVQGKFAEAAQKAISFCRDNHLTNSAIQELESYFNEEHYPGLGTVKKISLKNHLSIVSYYLKSL